jgi:hypothetical protein
MTFAQKCTSVFIAGHIVAILTIAIPWREALNSAANPIPRRIETGLRAAHAVARPIRPVAEVYESFTRLSQRWSMFSILRHGNLYAHVRFVIDKGRQAEPRFTRSRQLVFPVQTEETVRLRGAFVASYWTKAIERAITDYRSHLATPGGSLALEERHAHFAKALRLLSDRSEAQWRRHGSLVRAEIWIAVEPMTPPGLQPDAMRQERRRRAIARYDEGWSENTRRPGDTPLLGTREADGDFDWTFSGSYEVTGLSSR